ncbi:hypothetical protein HanIR_Chr11g0557321 [Helianthus annuus]|nr:hypothetical protein HanIR_Chr11g0557321 [Helianthus annuus]
MFYHKSYPRARSGGVQKLSFETGIWLNSCVPARPADTNTAPKTRARMRQFLHSRHITVFFLMSFKN